MQADVVLGWPCTASAATANSMLSDSRMMAFIIRNDKNSHECEVFDLEAMIGVSGRGA